MNSNNNMIELQMELPIEHEKKVFGQFDEHIKILERSLAVTLISRDGVLKIVGPASNAARAKECLTQLLELSRRGNDITTQNVNYAISLVMEDSGSSLAEIDSDCICHTVAGRPVKPKTLGQKAYVDAIREKMIVFGVGPAGTGKTEAAKAIAAGLGLPYLFYTCSANTEIFDLLGQMLPDTNSSACSLPDASGD